MNRKLTNCENLVSLAYSSNAIEEKCFYNQTAVCVHSFSQPYPPLLATKEDIGKGKQKRSREERYLIYMTNIIYFSVMRNCCSSVHMLSVYSSQDPSRAFWLPGSGSVGLESSLMLAFLPWAVFPQSFCWRVVIRPWEMNRAMTSQLSESWVSSSLLSPHGQETTPS